MAAESKKIKVEYFAHFREARAASSEEVSTFCATARDLYVELDRRHSFGVAPEQTRVAINGKIVSWDSRIADGDTVVFLAPFGGG